MLERSLQKCVKMPRAFLLKSKKHSYRSYRQDRREGENGSEDTEIVENTTLDWQSGFPSPEHTHPMDAQQEPVDLSIDMSCTMPQTVEETVGKLVEQAEKSMEKTKDLAEKNPSGTTSSAIWRPHEGKTV